MSYIINIETSTSVCSVALSFEGKLISIKEETEGMKHASLLTVFIQEILVENKITVSDLSAVAVSFGPGSYTGLRIGISAAKGLCYACDLPLILVSSLDSIAYGIRHHSTIDLSKSSLIYPMIDARRMEVYSACYDVDLNIKSDYHALIIEDDSFFKNHQESQIILGGDGSLKFKELAQQFQNVYFSNTLSSSKYMIALAYQKYLIKDFADLAYSEPFYLKEFQAGSPSSKA